MELEKIKEIEKDVEQKFKNEYSGHDWWHIKRVINLSIKLARREGADEKKSHIIALLHDLFDEKIFDIKNKEEEIKKFIVSRKLDKLFTPNTIDDIVCDLLNLSFRGKFDNQKLSLEGKIVQDADRLDAIGAIGIARVFAYGGNKKHAIYVPNKKIVTQLTEKQYMNNDYDQIAHFYIKLLKIKDNLNTESARRIAKNRHKFMEEFLQQFFYEWND